MRQLFSVLLLASITFMATSCSKDGDTGATGAQGQKGDKGDGGPAGPAGPKGDPGTANVIYSNWLDLPLIKDPTQNNGNYYNAAISVNQLSQDMLTKGVIKVYLNVNSADDPIVVPLPYTDESGKIIRFVASNQTIDIIANFDASTKTTNGKKYNQYRYVLVPGGTAANGQPVNWNDYEEVKAQLDLNN